MDRINKERIFIVYLLACKPAMVHETTHCILRHSSFWEMKKTSLMKLRDTTLGAKCIGTNRILDELYWDEM